MQSNETPVDGARKWLDDEDNQDVMIFAGGVFFAALLGVYFGGGRHLKHIRTDIHVLRNAGKEMAGYLEAKEMERLTDMDRISRAIDQGIKFKHFPGLGVFYPDGGITKAMR